MGVVSSQKILLQYWSYCRSRLPVLAHACKHTMHSLTPTQCTHLHPHNALTYTHTMHPHTHARTHHTHTHTTHTHTHAPHTHTTHARTHAHHTRTHACTHAHTHTQYTRWPLVTNSNQHLPAHMVVTISIRKYRLFT